MGETATVNKGISLAKGQIICVVNSDDPLFTPQAVSKAVEYLNNNPQALMAYSDWVSIDASGHVLEEHRLPDYTIQNMLCSGIVQIGPGIFIYKSTYDKIGLRSRQLKYTGDLEFSFRATASGQIVHIPHILATHRVHDGALSSTAKGALMAKEVAELAEFYIGKPEVNALFRRDTNKVYARWYFNAMYFAMPDKKAALLYLSKGLRRSFIFMSGLVIAALLRMACKKITALKT
jgi:hypothetical protein